MVMSLFSLFDDLCHVIRRYDQNAVFIGQNRVAGMYRYIADADGHVQRPAQISIFGRERGDAVAPNWKTRSLRFAYVVASAVYDQPANTRQRCGERACSAKACSPSVRAA